MATAKELYRNFDSNLLDMNNLNWLLEASEKLIEQYPNGINQPVDYKLAISILKDLYSFEMWMSSTKQYEGSFKELRRIRTNELELIKVAIPESHKEIREIINYLFG